MSVIPVFFPAALCGSKERRRGWGGGRGGREGRRKGVYDFKSNPIRSTQPKAQKFRAVLLPADW